MLISLDFHNFASAPIAFSYASRIVFECALSQIWVEIYAASLNPHLRYCSLYPIRNVITASVPQWFRAWSRRCWWTPTPFKCPETHGHKSRFPMLNNQTFVQRVVKTSVVVSDRRTDRQSRQTKYNRLTRVPSSANCALHKCKVSTCLKNLPLAIK